MKNVLIGPIITEKSLKRVVDSQYTFAVEKNVNKYEIKNAIEKEYKVKVLSIKTMIRKGKTKQVGKKRNYKTEGSRKFAIVEIPKDQKINEFNQ